MRYLVHDKITGEILRQGAVPDGSDWHLLQAQADHEAVLLPPEGVAIDDSRHRVDVTNGTIVAKPPPPAGSVATAALAALRHRRQRLLGASDWTQLADAPLTAETRAAWATYRQALRDLPATTPDPAKAVWPPAPSLRTES